MYQDLKSRFLWTKMKIEIARYVAKCDVCQRVKVVHLKFVGQLQSEVCWTIAIVAYFRREMGRYQYGFYRRFTQDIQGL
jgi:hypothetical protein